MRRRSYFYRGIMETRNNLLLYEAIDSWKFYIFVTPEKKKSENWEVAVAVAVAAAAGISRPARTERYVRAGSIQYVVGRI